MKEKIYEPARHNETSPAEGMAAVNTHMPEETPLQDTKHEEQVGKPGEISKKEEGERAPD